MLQQQVRSPEYLFFEADKKKQFMSGSEAVREAIRKANVDVAISYPITPQSESMHFVGDLFAEGYAKEYFRGENEFAVMSSVAGAGEGLRADAGPGERGKPQLRGRGPSATEDCWWQAPRRSERGPGRDR